MENGILDSSILDCLFFHVVFPLTISSFWVSPWVWRRCVYLRGTLSKDPSSPLPSMISEAKENLLSGLMSLFCFKRLLRIPSSSGSQSDWTIFELPHSLLYSKMMPESWWDSKNWSGIVCRKNELRKNEHVNKVFCMSYQRDGGG
jgi:hypothetical protein